MAIIWKTGNASDDGKEGGLAIMMDTLCRLAGLRCVSGEVGSAKGRCAEAASAPAVSLLLPRKAGAWKKGERKKHLRSSCYSWTVSLSLSSLTPLDGG